MVIGNATALDFQRMDACNAHAEAATTLPDAVSDALQRGEYDGVLFFSPRTAAARNTLSLLTAGE